MATPNIILPEKGKKNVLITSALPYVNNVPHLGNVIGSVLSADVFSRYSKLRDRPTLFICGTDEYGTATETRALETGQTPQELCDEFHKKHKDIYDWFDISFDYFGRTTTQQQTEIAQDIFLKLHKNGYLEERTTKQPYCEKHQSFLADRFVEGTCPKCGDKGARGDQCDKCGSLLDPLELLEPRCKVDGATPVPRDTTHIFLRLDKTQDALEEWVAKTSVEGGWSANAASIAKAWLDKGLEGRSITRDLKWGTPVPLPGYEKKVLYVWFDACIGYPSITANYTKDWELWWRNPEEVELYQFMGKDNVQFHTIIFPGSQIGTKDKWTKVSHLSVTEYLNYESGKFSKSRGIGVFGDTAQLTGIHASVWRYYLLSNRPETGDTQFEWKFFIAANNSELLANLGNFVNRLIKFVNAKLDSVVPEYSIDYEDEADKAFNFPQLVKDVNVALEEYNADMEATKLRNALTKVMRISSLGNLLLQGRVDNANLLNHEKRTHTVIGVALSLTSLIASIVSPFMPAIAESIATQLNLPKVHSIPDKWNVTFPRPGHNIGKAQHLFSRIPEEKEKEWQEKYGGTQASRAAEDEAKAQKAADKLRDKERKKAKKEAEKAKKEAEAAGSTSAAASKSEESEKPTVGEKENVLPTAGSNSTSAAAEKTEEKPSIVDKVASLSLK